MTVRVGLGRPDDELTGDVADGLCNFDPPAAEVDPLYSHCPDVAGAEAGVGGEPDECSVRRGD
jgi:hypothetical protein